MFLNTDTLKIIFDLGDFITQIHIVSTCKYFAGKMFITDLYNI